MEQIYNTMLDIVQRLTDRQTEAAQAAQQNDTAAFRKLLDKHVQASGREDAESGNFPETTDAPQETPGRREETDLHAAAIQGQLAWAAVVLAQPAADAEVDSVTEFGVPPQALAEAILPVVSKSEPAAGEALLMETPAGPDGPAEPAMAQKADIAAQPAGRETPHTVPEDSSAPAVEGTGAEQRPQPPEDRRDSARTVRDTVGEAHALFQRPEATLIKVGEAPAAETPQSPANVAKQLAGGLAETLRHGDTQVKIQLEPAALGSVQVELIKGQDGALHILLTAESPQTRGLLERSAAGLQSLLSHGGTQTVQVEVPRQQESQQQSFYDGRGSTGQNSREQEQQQHSRHQTQDFLQQLRLGLVPLETEAV